MGITLLTKEITPKNIFYRNEIQYSDDVPTKRKVGIVTSSITQNYIASQTDRIPTLSITQLLIVRLQEINMTTKT